MRKYLLLISLFFLSCGLSPGARAKMVLEQGLKDSSPVVRINAAMGLNSETASVVLTEIFMDGENEAKAAVLQSISENRELLSESLIVEACSNPNPSVREAAYRVVALSEFVNARDLLLQGTQDELVAVRVISYGGLARFGDREFLQQGIRDPETRVRIASAKALGELGRAGMPEFIKDELKKSTPDLLGIGIIAMAELSDTASIPLFKVLLKEGAGDLRIDAAEALLILGDDTGVGALKNGLQSNDPFVRIHATEVLTRHNVPETYPHLEAATRDEFMNVAVRAVKALAQHEPGKYKELFKELMDAQNPLLRIAAATAYLRSLDGA
jgi:HEAT repeat protein